MCGASQFLDTVFCFTHQGLWGHPRVRRLEALLSCLQFSSEAFIIEPSSSWLQPSLVVCYTAMLLITICYARGIGAGVRLYVNMNMWMYMYHYAHVFSHPNSSLMCILW